MPFEEGHEKVGGRKAGTPNKTTVQLKDAIMAAFDEVGAQKYLVRIAISEPNVFCALLGRVLPKDINVEGHLTLGGLLKEIREASKQREGK